MFKDTSGSGDIHLHVSRFAVIVSTAVLEIIGLIAGLLPALKASRVWTRSMLCATSNAASSRYPRSICFCNSVGVKRFQPRISLREADQIQFILLAFPLNRRRGSE